MRTYALKLLAITFVLIGALFAGSWKLLGEMPVPTAHLVIAFFAFTSYYGYYLMIKAAEKENRQFVTYFMALFGGKFLLAIILLATLIYIDKAHKNIIALVFGVCYLIYTVFEVFEMLKVLRATSNDDTSN